MDASGLARQTEDALVAEFTLPKNSKISKKGRTYQAE